MPTSGNPDQPRGVDITVRRATGTGTTPLAAFDAALLAARVANFNLIPLSSVIPPHSTVTLTEEPLAGTHGDRLYCVLASAYATTPGEQVWAGLGWVVDPRDGKGLFVEHTATSEAHLREQIEATLADMCRTRGGGYGAVQTALASATCEERPACALVLAAYEVEGWTVPEGEHHD